MAKRVLKSAHGSSRRTLNRRYDVGRRQALPFRWNIPKLAELTYTQIDETYPAWAAEIASGTEHVIVGGENYGQGSSREHAAITPRDLRLRMVIAKSFARIHWQNLANFGILRSSSKTPATTTGSRNSAAVAFTESPWSGRFPVSGIAIVEVRIGRPTRDGYRLRCVAPSRHHMMTTRHRTLAWLTIEIA